MSSPRRERIYLDHNATSPLAEGVVEAVVAALSCGGNPNSPHAEGRGARRLLESSRLQIARSLGAEALDLVFCSGGTEANHLGLVGLARSGESEGRVLLAPTLHPSLEAAGASLSQRGIQVDPLAVDERGRIDQLVLERELGKGDVKLVAFSLANHETGAIEDAAAIVDLAKTNGALVYCDAVQAWGRIPVDLGSLGFHGAAFSAHKIGGPKGVGVLWLKPGPDVRPLIGGGEQEGGRRPGTQACGLVAGFAAAVAGLENRLLDAERQRGLRRAAEEGLMSLGATLHSGPGGLCNTISARFEGVAGDLLVSSLDLEGVAISTGAACSSGTTEASTNLLAMGLNEEQALESIRISMGPTTREQDVEVLIEVLPAIVSRARKFS